jgi:hemerythrin-like domain-containing protein
MMVSGTRKQLADDHEAVHEVLAQLVTALQNKDLTASYVKLDLLWARLAVHIRAEHLHLFPAVTSRMSEAQTTVERLREDHDFFMRELARAVGILRELPRPLSSEDESRLSSVLDVVLAVEKRLADHNDIEEKEVYHWAATVLTETEQIDLAARVNAELENRPSRFSVEAWANRL